MAVTALMWCCFFATVAGQGFTPYTWVENGPLTTSPIQCAPVTTNATTGTPATAFLYVFYCGGSSSQIYYQRSSDGFTWSSESPIITVPSGVNTLTAIQNPVDQNIYLMWTAGNGAISYAVSFNGLSWFGPQATNSTNAVIGSSLGFYPSVSTDINNPFVLFHTFTATSVTLQPVLMWSQFVGGSFWSVPVPFPEQTGNTPLTLARAAITNVYGLPGPLLVYNPYFVSPTPPLNYTFTTYNGPTQQWSLDQSTAITAPTYAFSVLESVGLSQFITSGNGQQVVLTYLGNDPDNPSLNYAASTPWGPFISYGPITVGGTPITAVTNSIPSSAVFTPNTGLPPFLTQLFVFYQTSSGISYVTTSH